MLEVFWNPHDEQSLKLPLGFFLMMIYQRKRGRTGVAK